MSSNGRMPLKFQLVSGAGWLSAVLGFLGHFDRPLFETIVSDFPALLAPETPNWLIGAGLAVMVGVTVGWLTTRDAAPIAQPPGKP